MTCFFDPMLEVLQYAFRVVFPFFIVVLVSGITFIILKHVYFWIRDIMESGR